MRKQFELYLLRMVIYMIRSRHLGRSIYFNPTLNEQLWAASQRVEAVIMTVKGQLEYSSEFDMFFDPKDSGDRPNATW